MFIFKHRMAGVLAALASAAAIAILGNVWDRVGTLAIPGGSGTHIRISGYEDSKIGPDGLIADSKGPTMRNSGFDK